MSWFWMSGSFTEEIWSFNSRFLQVWALVLWDNKWRDSRGGRARDRERLPGPPLSGSLPWPPYHTLGHGLHVLTPSFCSFPRWLVCLVPMAPGCVIPLMLRTPMFQGHCDKGSRGLVTHSWLVLFKCGRSGETQFPLGMQLIPQNEDHFPY